jgi:hypothetical protein
MLHIYESAGAGKVVNFRGRRVSWFGPTTLQELEGMPNETGI